ncbi:type IV pilus twitching motility protein PilT [bacterium]|nr:MAG: type IV pilus twitching motility protein PilT [bacterium]
MTLEELDLRKLIQIGYDKVVSDVYVKAGQVPMMRLNGAMVPCADDMPVVTGDAIEKLVTDMMTERQKQIFAETWEMDLAFEIEGQCRVRMNVYRQRGTAATVMRIIPFKVRTLDELNLPPVLKELCKQRLGLILVTGPTGSGKTTTLAAMIDHINRNRAGHIVTIEDPLEYVHQDQQCYVSHREIGFDTLDFHPALRAVLREAPDIILIGEMRDTTTMGVALSAGETGHLVFSTVHTASAYETMDRIMNMFQPHEREYMRVRMAGCLRAIVAQKLVPRADGQGRVVAQEILVCTPTVQKAIEDGHFSDLYHHMNEGSFWGMQTMNQSLLRYVKAGIVSEETALRFAGVASELKQMLRR